MGGVCDLEQLETVCVMVETWPLENWFDIHLLRDF